MNDKSEKIINARYTESISDEPKQLLQPISGYTREPVSSLEEACQPLLDIVPRLPAYIWVAKQNSKNPPEGLSQDESAAIHLYTMEWDNGSNEEYSSLYSNLNRTLKQVDRTKLRPWFRYLKLFLSALVKLPCGQRQTVWRGVRKNHSDDYPPGAEITWWAFSSCTASLSVLDSDLYLGKVGTRTIFSIEAINARSIRSHSHFQTEDEILLLPGTYLEVKSRLNPAPDLYIVHLQQKIPPHDLLEPPFEGAHIFAPVMHQFQELQPSTSNEKAPTRPWYKTKRFFFGTCLSVLLIIIIILLTLLLVLLRRRLSDPNTSAAPRLPAYNANITVFDPVSVAYAFYAFDNNILDLYRHHDGSSNEKNQNYIVGYVGYGSAIVFNQSMSTSISISTPFNLSSIGFTIELFIIIFNNSTNGNLIQFSSGMSFNIQMSHLEFILNSRYSISSMQTLLPNTWYHIAVVCNTLSQTTSLFINGQLDIQSSYPSLNNSVNDNVMMTIGMGFNGIVDQLSISLETKTNNRIEWDATTVAYYPFDGDNNGWLLDYGPHCFNGTSSGVQSTNGVDHDALNFSISGAYFQAPGFTVLNIPYHEFSVALWIQLASQSGIFLTIANSIECLLVLGIRTVDNRLIAYMPQASNTNTSINLIGSLVTKNQWIHVAFTWSSQNQAQLFQKTILQERNTNATKLNNGSGEPMTITLGMYHGLANCSGGDGLDTNEQFNGLIDECYIFSKELSQNDIESLNLTTYI